MKRKSKTAQTKSLSLALYFGLVVLFIILISISFKVFDTFRKSRFDGQNRFTIAVIGSKSAEYISVSPKDGSLTKLNIAKISNNNIQDLVLFDAFIKTDSDYSKEVKTSFVKLLFSSKSKKTNLTIIDYIRLILYSQGVPNDKIISVTASGVDDKKLNDKTSSYFIDPIILDEKSTIQIINATGITGLGNKYAKLIGNLGGNVALVNSSKEIESNSKILFKLDNYTVKKLSKTLNIKKELQEESSISDVIIILGRDIEEGMMFE